MLLAIRKAKVRKRLSVLLGNKVIRFCVILKMHDPKNKDNVM